MVVERAGVGNAARNSAECLLILNPAINLVEEQATTPNVVKGILHIYGKNSAQVVIILIVLLDKGLKHTI
jgi:hypothetical protein